MYRDGKRDATRRGAVPGSSSALDTAAAVPGKRTLVMDLPVAAPAGSGTAMPDATRVRMEAVLGFDLSDVRIHPGVVEQTLGARALPPVQHDGQPLPERAPDRGNGRT